MYPYFSLPFFDARIYTFWLFLCLAFGSFFFILQRTGKKASINTNFFISNALLFVVSTFFFSRLVFILLEWRDYQYQILDRFWNFFVMNDYNMSFAGWIIGFLIILIIKLRKHQQPLDKYLDVIVLSFLFAGIIGYIWAFLGGQIYGRPTHLPIWILYKSDRANIPYTSAVIPLWILYSCSCFVLFSGLYIFRELQKIPGFTGYVWLWLFSIVLLIWEFYSGSEDILQTYIILNINQLLALTGIAITWHWLWKQIQKQ
jgi:prolipoprotein diacylglyceryltransferase